MCHLQCLFFLLLPPERPELLTLKWEPPLPPWEPLLLFTQLLVLPSPILLLLPSLSLRTVSSPEPPPHTPSQLPSVPLLQGESFSNPGWLGGLLYSPCRRLTEQQGAVGAEPPTCLCLWMASVGCVGRSLRSQSCAGPGLRVGERDSGPVLLFRSSCSTEQKTLYEMRVQKGTCF